MVTDDELRAWAGDLDAPGAPPARIAQAVLGLLQTNAVLNGENLSLIRDKAKLIGQVMSLEGQMEMLVGRAQEVRGLIERLTSRKLSEPGARR